jgi:pyruvate dehydrogenase E1 component alpha subunit
MIAKGGEMKRMMAELYGRIDGYCKGKSGSLHIADFSIGVLGANGIVGGGIPIAAGAGYSIKLRGTSQVAVCFFGDGAVTQGTFHESVNMAATWDLPVIFVIENNLYMVGTFTERVCKVCQEYSLKAPGYGIPGEDIDGNDVITVYKSVEKAVQRARKGKGPTLLNCQTYRHNTHFVGDLDVRDKDEIDYWMAKDPIKNLEKQMLEAKIIDEGTIKDSWKRIQEEVDEAVDFARKSPVPSQEIAMEDVFAE